MIDLRVNDKGDIIVDPVTHDFEMVDGIEEIAQRIKATLQIRYGEMVNLDPEMGSDYSNFLGKNFDENGASADMTASITAHVPEVESVDEITFKHDQRRHLIVHFVATVDVGDGNTDTVEEDYTLGA